jgi:hypothetical protein
MSEPPPPFQEHDVCIRKRNNTLCMYVLGREGVWRKTTNTLKLGHLFLYLETSWEFRGFFRVHTQYITLSCCVYSHSTSNYLQSRLVSFKQ